MDVENSGRVVRDVHTLGLDAVERRHASPREVSGSDCHSHTALVEFDGGEAYRPAQRYRPGGRDSKRAPALRIATDELTQAEAAAAKIHSYPRPSLLEEPLEGLDALNIATWGDLVEHLPHSHRDRRELRSVGELMVGEEATVGVTVRSVSVKPMRNRRQKRVEARVFDESGPLVAVWFNQPWLARQLGEGAQVLLHGKLRQRNQFWVTEHELLGGRGTGAHRGTRAGAPGDPGREPAAPARARLEGVPAHVRGGRPAARAPARRGGAARPARGARRRPLPRPRGGRARRPPAARLRGAVPAPARRGGAPARPARGAPRATAGGARRGGGPLALVAPVRAHGRPAAGDRGDRRGPGGRAPDAAPADGGSRKRQDRDRAGGDAARGRERRPGGPDGAHRDARRAAPPHARLAARRPAAGGAPHRLHERRAAARAARAGWPPGSSSSWWARTR